MNIVITLKQYIVLSIFILAISFNGVSQTAVQWDNLATSGISQSGNVYQSSSVAASLVGCEILPAGQDGYIEFTINQSYTATTNHVYGIGFWSPSAYPNTDPNTIGLYSDISYVAAGCNNMYYQRTTNYAEAYNQWFQNDPAGSAGKVFKIERINNVITFYLDGSNIANATYSESLELQPILIMDGGSGSLDVSVVVSSGFSCGNANNLAITLNSLQDATLDGGGISNTDGAIDISASGGTLPYNYEWFIVNDPNNPTLISTSEDLSNLDPGDYKIVVTDSNSDTVEETYTVGPENYNGGNNCTVAITNVSANCTDNNSQTYTINFDYAYTNAADQSLVIGILSGNNEEVEVAFNIPAGSDGNGSFTLSAVGTGSAIDMFAEFRDVNGSNPSCYNTFPDMYDAPCNNGNNTTLTDCNEWGLICEPTRLVHYPLSDPTQLFTMYDSGKLEVDRIDVLSIVYSEQVKVQPSSEWPDYVFGQNYHLRSLSEVEQFIKKHQHLPNIPSANEVQESGIELGEMNRLLLEKIEELTLYTIQQDKAVSEQEEKIKSLEKSVNLLLKEIELLKE